MNYLAHAYLSGGDEQVLTGNFIADRIKGKAYQDYPSRIKTGILLHRFIDDFTDSHEINRKASRLLSPYFKKYSSVVTDVMNDHLLAIAWHEYHTDSLKEFIRFTYNSISANENLLPEKSKMMLPYMIKQDWLGSYQKLEGISDVLKRMSKRTPFVSGMENAFEPLQLHYEELTGYFKEFFPDLKNATHIKLKILLENE